MYTAYNTIVYLKLGLNGQKLLASTNPRAEISFPVRPQRKKAGSSKKLPTNPLAISDGDGWISTTSKPKKARPVKAKSSSAKAKFNTAKNSTVKVGGKGRKSASKRKTTSSEIPIIVEINSSESESDDEDDDFIPPKRRGSSSKKRKEIADDDGSNDSDL